MTASLLAVLIIASVLQVVATCSMGSRRPVGDERSYLQLGGASDPLAPQLFLRPPILPLLAALFCRKDAAGERFLRLFMSLVSVATVGFTAAAATQHAGMIFGLTAAVCLLAQPERVVLGCHIWPDNLLAFLLAVQMWLLTLPEPGSVALVAGAMLSTLGVLTRIDFLVAVPLFALSWWTSHGPTNAILDAALVAAPLLALVILTGCNLRRYGTPLPDDTWAFNLMVMASPLRHDRDEELATEALIEHTVRDWAPLGSRERARRGLLALVAILRSPGALVRGLARRLATILGPDVFIKEMLLPANRAYPTLKASRRRRLESVLAFSFPLLAAVALVTLSLTALQPRSFLWPSCGMAIALVLVHTRTRFRVAVMPALSLLAADGLTTACALLAEPSLRLAGALIATAMLTVALVRIRSLRELPSADRAGTTLQTAR